MESQPEGSETGSLTRQGIQSIEIAFRVVEAVEKGRGPLSLSQIASASGLSASKAHRYLVSLARVGVVSQSQRAGLYDFGPTMRRLGIEALRRTDEVGTATEFLSALRDRTGHAVNLAAWGDNGPVVVHWEYGAHALPMNVRVGSTLPLLDSSVGQVFLTYLPRTMTQAVLEASVAAGELEESDFARAAEIQSRVREKGTAVTRGGVIAGLASVGAPAFAEGAPPLAISVALPVRMATPDEISAVSQELLATADEITTALGGIDS